MERNRIIVITGIVVFLIAELVYLLTIAPSTSYWDCSEFITCAYKLEVGHAPGAPVFMLLGRLFSLLAGNDTSKVAMMINILSATASALTILFLFKILVWFCEKLIARITIEISQQKKQLLVISASAIGALSYAFTDSFWFSAVEGEVYATSSLFSALVFWCIIKWEESESKGWKQTRWIYLMFFLLGLSVGIHLLNMLALPAIALVYYSKRFKISVKGVIISQSIAMSLLLLFVFIIIPGIAKLTAYTDLFFVNVLKLPVYYGAISFILFLGIALKISYSSFRRKGYNVMTIALLAFTFWLVGYSSFAVLVIRSNANPFVDINNVENLFGLVDYLNREQYPMRPLVKGNNFNSPIVDSKKRYTYKYYQGQYYKDELNPKYIFDKKTLTPFPRMASLDKDHKPYYEKWVDIKGRKVKVRNGNGEMKTINVPTFSDNLKFFIRYQIGHMYFRYFMWNFVGKQNDIQGMGDALNGNWISGIPFIDTMRLGNQEILPDKYREHKARNKYYFLPLLLGLMGMIYHYKKDKLGFSVVMLLFLLTGVAIAVYLNEIPITPRERDYAYVGSFFAFSIWIGIGCIAIVTSIKRLSSNTYWYIGILGLLTIIIPVNLLKQNWGDHNRSGRKVAHDLAGNILESLAPNSILFTYGDNDTYPIWYLQEVESKRTDVRHILYTFLAIDWYAGQLQFSQKNKGNVPISFKDSDLLMSKNNYFPIVKKLDSYVELGELIDFVQNQDKRTKIQLVNGDLVNYLPSDRIILKVNKDNVARTCSYIDINNSELLTEIKFTLNKQYLTRDQLLLLDIIAQNKWERPLYFMSPHSIAGLGLGAYLHREGSVFRLLPFKSTLPGEVLCAKTLEEYENIMQKYKWGNINDSGVYLDNTCLNTIQTFRFSQVFSELAIELYNQGQLIKAQEILALSKKVLPIEKVGYNAYSHKVIEAYYLTGNKTEADNLAMEILDYQKKLMYYFESENISHDSRHRDLDLGMYLATEVLKLASTYSPEIVEQYGDEIQRYYSSLFAWRY